VTTIPAKQSKLREILKNDYVKTAILIVIIIGSVLSFQFGIRIVLRTEYPFMDVVTGSMVPTLNVGDLVVVQGYADLSMVYAAPPKWDENRTRVLEGGDIVVFLHWSGPDEGVIDLVHRAVGNVTVHGKRYLITQGDSIYNPSPDTHRNITAPYDILPGLPEEYVVGKVIAHAPFLGQVATFMQTPSVRIIIIVLIVALLIVEFIPFSKKKDKEQVPAQEQVEA